MFWEVLLLTVSEKTDVTFSPTLLSISFVFLLWQTRITQLWIIYFITNLSASLLIDPISVVIDCKVVVVDISALQPSVKKTFPLHLSSGKTVHNDPDFKVLFQPDPETKMWHFSHERQSMCSKKQMKNAFSNSGGRSEILQSTVSFRHLQILRKNVYGLYWGSSIHCMTANWCWWRSCCPCGQCRGPHLDGPSRAGGCELPSHWPAFWPLHPSHSGLTPPQTDSVEQ